MASVQTYNVWKRNKQIQKDLPNIGTHVKIEKEEIAASSRLLKLLE